MRVKAIVDIPAKGKTIKAGSVFDAPVSALGKLRGRVTATGETGEEYAACNITGDVCRITYSNDLYQKHRHRDGERTEVDGQTLTIRIERAATC